MDEASCEALSQTGPQMLNHIRSETPSLSCQKHTMKRRLSSTFTNDRFLSNDRKENRNSNNQINTDNIFSKTFTPRRPLLFTPSKKSFVIKPSIVETILDAPDVFAQSPAQLIDVNSTNSIIVALGPSVYLYQKGNVTEILEADTPINSVCWVNSREIIVSAKGQVELWDVNQSQIVRSFQSHEERSCATSAALGHRVATGGKDSIINISDIRSAAHYPLHSSRRGEISSVKWSPDGTNLASISEDDSKIVVWGNKEMKTIYSNFSNSNATNNDHSRKEERLSSIEWQSHQVLVTGDKGDKGMIKYIPIQSHEEEKSFSSGTPVSGLSWSSKWGLVISHRGVSPASSFWEIRNNDFKRTSCIGGYMGDIINIVTSEDNSMIATISEDETLRTYELKMPNKYCEWTDFDTAIIR